MNDRISNILHILLTALLSFFFALLVLKEIPPTLKIICGIAVLVLVCGIILLLTAQPERNNLLLVPGPAGLERNVMERLASWLKFFLFIVVPLLILTGLGVISWWWRIYGIPGDVAARRILVHEIQAEVELPNVCGEVTQSGRKLWFRRLNAIDYELVYEERLDPDGHKLRLYYSNNKRVAVEELRAQHDYVQGYYEGGSTAFAYDLLDQDRRPKELIYKRQNPAHRFAPSTTAFWGDPEPFRATSPDFHPCQRTIEAQETPGIPAALAVLPPAIGYR